MEDKIKLSEILKSYIAFKDDPSNEEKYKNLTAYQDKLQVREYLPMLDKQLVLTLMLTKIENQDKDAVATQMNLEILKIIYGLMAYCINLENDLGFEALLNSFVVDALYASGIVGYILDFCESDYKLLCDMVQGTINFSNLFRIVDTMSLFSEEKLEELRKTTEDLRKLTLSSDKIDKLVKIFELNDPRTMATLEAMEAAAVASAIHNAGDKENKEVPIAQPEEHAEPEQQLEEEASEEVPSSSDDDTTGKA